MAFLNKSEDIKELKSLIVNGRTLGQYKDISKIERLALLSKFNESSELVEHFSMLLGLLTPENREAALLIIFGQYEMPLFKQYTQNVRSEIRKFISFKPLEGEVIYESLVQDKVNGYFKRDTTVHDRVDNSYEHMLSSDPENREYISHLPLETYSLVTGTCSISSWLEAEKIANQSTLNSKWSDLLNLQKKF
jgi:hypothetical protein